MKQKELLDELIELSKQVGFVIRRDKGNFKSGFCKINEINHFIINKSTSIETQNSIMAQGLSEFTDKMYIKPMIRDYIEQERLNRNNLFRLDVNY